MHAQKDMQKQCFRPRPDDRIHKQQVEYKSPGKCGRDVLWDFSKQSLLDDNYVVSYRSLGTSTDTVIGTEHQTRYYYYIHDDSLWLNGYENQTTRMKYDNPELLIRFPIVYGDSISDEYYGNGIFCNTIGLIVGGTSTTVVDACGMMILPSCDTLNNIIRTHNRKIMLKDTHAIHMHDSLWQKFVPQNAFRRIQQNMKHCSDSNLMCIDTYRWYACGYRYPIFETIISTNLCQGNNNPYFATSFYYPPTGHEYLATDDENMLIQEQLEPAISMAGRSQDSGRGNKIESDLKMRYNFYPNPVESMLTIELFISAGARVSYDLFTLSGLCIYKKDFGILAAGVHNYQIDLPHIPTGEYLLRMQVNENTYTEKIIKK